MNGKQLYIRNDESRFLGMSVAAMLEDLTESAKNPQFNWTPAARKIIKEMITAGTSLKVKLEGQGFDVSPLPPFEQGDEDEFLTKPS
jgi:hypothetical protein